MMKQLLLSAFLITSLAGCKKNKEYCWACSWQETRIYPRQPAFVDPPSIEEVCSMTEEEARAYEKENSEEYGSGSDIRITTVKCAKK